MSVRDNNKEVPPEALDSEAELPQTPSARLYEVLKVEPETGLLNLSILTIRPETGPVELAVFEYKDKNSGEVIRRVLSLSEKKDAYKLYKWSLSPQGGHPKLTLTSSKAPSDPKWTPVDMPDGKGGQAEAISFDPLQSAFTISRSGGGGMSSLRFADARSAELLIAATKEGEYSWGEFPNPELLLQLESFMNHSVYSYWVRELAKEEKTKARASIAALTNLLLTLNNQVDVLRIKKFDIDDHDKFVPLIIYWILEKSKGSLFSDGQLYIDEVLKIFESYGITGFSEQAVSRLLHSAYNIENGIVKRSLDKKGL